jgi:hypothetical protein
LDTDNENAADNVWTLSEMAITPLAERKKKSMKTKAQSMGSKNVRRHNWHLGLESPSHN